MIDKLNDKNITGLMFYYYWICKRKLWYFFNDICMEQNNENVKIGKVIDENSYDRENKHINIDDVINIDFIKEERTLHEIKKSRKIEESGIWQIKYYLFYLKERGVVDLKGKIDYPLLKQSVDVDLSSEDEEVIRRTLIEIEKIVHNELPQQIDKRKICQSCAYYDLCWI